MAKREFASIEPVIHQQKHMYDDDETRMIHLFAFATDDTLWGSIVDAKTGEHSDWIRMKSLPDTEEVPT